MPGLGRTATAAAPPAQATPACASVTAPGQQAGQTQTLAVQLTGSVTCAKAHSLLAAYFAAIANGGCAGHGSSCSIDFPGGWNCAVLSPVEIAEGDGRVGGCGRGQPLRAAVVLYPEGARPRSLRVDQFRSPDLSVWCTLDATTGAFCATGGNAPKPGGPERSASMDARGRVRTCHVAHAGARRQCVQNWNFEATPLVTGQQTARHGFRCTAIDDGIQCVRINGAAKGKGFFVSRTAARTIGP
jgi:hypothetical protein